MTAVTIDRYRPQTRVNGPEGAPKLRTTVPYRLFVRVGLSGRREAYPCQRCAKNRRNHEPLPDFRFAVFCEGVSLPAAYAKCVEGLLATPGLELALIVRGNPLKTKKSALWSFFESKLIKGHLSSLEPIDISQRVIGVPVADSRDIKTISTYGLDFIFQCTLGPVAGDLAAAAKQGVWSFRFGTRGDMAAPPGFWEFYLGDPTTVVALERITAGQQRIVLHQGVVATELHSYAQNFDALMWAASYMPVRVGGDLVSGEDANASAAYVQASSLTDRGPSNIEMLAFLGKTIRRWLKRQVESIFFLEDWNIGFVHEPARRFLEPQFQPQVDWLKYRTNGRYVADPFLLNMGPKVKLLAEEFDWRFERGYIVEYDLQSDEQVAPDFQKAIDEGIHMSYPYAFEFGGRYYCLPEASQKGDVWLYLYDTSTGRWMRSDLLLTDFAAVDPTLFEYEGSWWLLCTNAKDEVQSKLFVFQAKSPFGPWTPHCRNPVKMDVRSSRPAGRPFIADGQLYRPAQDCSTTYGGAIYINRITSLTPTTFREEPVAHVMPLPHGRYRAGVHTLNSHGSTTVIDGKGMIFAPRSAYSRLRRKLTRLGQKQ
jgi:hypothetical protein